MKALASGPADRFESAEAFATALTAPAPGRPRARSVAVLPFLNLSTDPENEFFADGITEDVTAQLSKIRSLKVISRTSVMPFKKREQSLQEIGARLDVDTLLEGSVRRAGNRVRITAQLIDASSGHHLWADRYDRELADVFAVQDEIALNITGAIAPGIISAEIQEAQRKDASQLDAWDRIMRAHWHIRRFTREDLAVSGISTYETEQAG